VWFGQSSAPPTASAASDQRQDDLDRWLGPGRDEVGDLGVPLVAEQRLVQLGEQFSDGLEPLLVRSHVQIDGTGRQQPGHRRAAVVSDLDVRPPLADPQRVRREHGSHLLRDRIGPDKREPRLSHRSRIVPQAAARGSFTSTLRFTPARTSFASTHGSPQKGEREPGFRILS
jgi:hypothetical protein